MISIGDFSVYLDFCIARGDQIGVISIFDRSQQVVKAFCATLQLNADKLSLFINKNEIMYTGSYKSYIAPVIAGKEKYYHAIIVNEKLGESLMMCKEHGSGKDFFNLLMHNYDLPLLDWWGKELLDKAISEGYVNPIHENTSVYYGEYSISKNREFGGQIIDDLILYDVRLYSLKVLETHISELFNIGAIWLTKERQNDFTISTMDDYFSRYGNTLVDNLEKSIHPLNDLSGDVTNFTLKNIRLYPQQIAMVNGVIPLLQKNNYAIINEGMGTGKTIQALSMCEGYFVDKYFKSHRMSTLIDVYSNLNAIKYRNIVICPGHMVEKWSKEISKELAYVTVHVIKEFSQLVELRRQGRNRTNKEFYVISKDFAKLSYMSQPVPTRMKYKKAIYEKICNACDKVYAIHGDICPFCKHKGFHKGSKISLDDGLICSECGELLVINSKIDTDGNHKTNILQPADFTHPNMQNKSCYYCNCELWQPFIKNINHTNLYDVQESKRPIWYRVTHYSNQAHTNKKTVWVHRKYADLYFENIGKEPLKSKEDYRGSRKYSPATFIKKYMKNFFDFLIIDEAHQYKGGGTGQGNAMDALVKSSKKVLALTGTIAGGKADDMFYLLYRLDPKMMQSNGYNWNECMKFAEDYGTVEREYLLSNKSNDSINLTTRGRQIGSVKSKPGISPKIYTDFLLENTVTLDLADMSKYLPQLKEYVITVPFNEMELVMYSDYTKVLDRLKLASREKGGKSLLGKKLQFALSYLDKPFGEECIHSPHDGSLVCKIPQHPEIWDEISSKEKKIIEILEKELNEGRNCFVYAEYTASPKTCVTHRLKKLIGDRLQVPVAILESASPEPLKREAWIHEQAEKNGIRVFISNPRCVETGCALVSA